MSQLTLNGGSRKVLSFKTIEYQFQMWWKQDYYIISLVYSLLPLIKIEMKITIPAS